MFNTIMDLVLSFFSLYILESYFSIYFLKKDITLRTFVASFTYIVLQYFANSLSLISPVTLFLLNTIIVIMVVQIKFEGMFIHKFIMTILLLIIWMIAEVLVGYVFKYKGISYEQVELAGAVISKIFLLIIVKVIRTKKNWKTNQEISLKSSIGLLSIPISSIYIVHNIFALCSEIDDSLMFPFISSVIILCMNCMIFIIYDKLSLDEELRRNNMLFVQQLDLSERQMLERELSVQQFKRLRHDMNSHLFSIKVYIQNKQNEEAIAYINNIVETDGLSTKDICKTGHLMIDALINYRCTIAEEKGIRCSVFHQIPSTISFKNSDLCVVLGNALDNAIEATEKLEMDKRYINLRMLYNKGCFLIEIQNSFDGNIKTNGNGDFITTKQDKINHGIGMLSIKKIVNAYGGEMDVNVTQDKFDMTIMLYDSIGE